jgi:putative redox protein
MDAKVTWKSGLSFDGTSDSGFTLPLGADPDVGGKNDGFRPLELMAVSLAGCTAMDIISILTKKKQEVTAFEVKVHADRAEEFPKEFTRLDISYLIAGHSIDEVAVLRAIELSSTKYCAVQAMMKKVVPMGINYELYEDLNGIKELSKLGNYNG